MMKDRVLFRAAAGLLLAVTLAFTGCPTDAGGGDGPGDSAVTISVIPGVTPPETI
jgi:hypothetical protein